ncbi:deubiquitinase OTUD6B isoform X2 [Notolabrus celidotus]|uniref:deubiquitinase OTUD6B isoform X2 n=1 Tax=Notolabrus celidotus TaxID=1203425 RepID=UPI0014902595|nr:deubiquitinase OTUD6B isoform X2 [Notolabrus celidotus]
MEEETLETPEEQLAKQQRKEKKDLQAKIQSMKNAVPKNDKKRRKQLTEEIAKLEADLNQKHEEEISQVTSTVGTKVEDLSNGVEDLKMEDGEKEEVTQSRVSKAQKRRDKKAAQEKERESRIAEAEVHNLQGVRHQEGLLLAQKLAQQQLQIKEISSDGHCMYRAIEDQLAQRSQPGLVKSVKELRSCTAEHMRNHADDFLPFLTNPNTGDMYTTVASFDSSASFANRSDPGRFLHYKNWRRV